MRVTVVAVHSLSSGDYDVCVVMNGEVINRALLGVSEQQLRSLNSTLRELLGDVVSLALL